MTPQQYERLTELFHAALEIAPDQRAAFLDQVSDGDVDLRRELESLLAAHVERAAYTQKPPDDIAAGMLAQQDHSAVSAASLAPKTRIDRYEIRSLLGKGGMGEVYLAEDTTLRRLVALKLLPAAAAAADKDRMRRFVQEARAAAALSHPHIAQIFEVGEYEGTHFIAMELVDGVTLRTKIHIERTELRKLLKYLQQVAEGLAKAHAAGIVHRDLKPDNIMVTRDDYAKILDFGLAKLVETERSLGLGGQSSSEVGTRIMAQQSLAGMVMGTAGYMSPEQAQGKVKEIDQRSDIFSFGCILFEAATGQKAFEGQDILDSLHKIVHAPTPQIKETNANAPNELQRIVRRCLAKDPDERYQTIKDVAIELKEVRQGMTGAELDTTVPPSGGTETLGRQTNEQSAGPTSSAEYLATEIKRHKKGVAIIFVALVVAVGYGLYKFASRQKPPVSSPAIKMARLPSTSKVFAGLISPDGKHVVYGVEDAGQQSISVRQVVTTSNVPIVPPSEATYKNFSFTPDSNYLYFTKREKDGPNSLYRMPALGGTARTIVMENVTSRAAVSSDGKRIAFIRSPPSFYWQETSLVLANSDGSGEQVLATRKGPDNFFVGGIAWTPDGKSITCATGNLARKLVEVPLDGGAEKLINTPNWFAFMNIEWLPDGSGLIVTAREQRSSPSQIWYLSYPSGEARRITNDFSDYTDLSLTADTGTLVVLKRETTSHVWVAPDGDASRAKQLTTGTGRQDGLPAVNWTPDGRIIFDSTASGSRHTWIMNADGSDQRQLNDGAYEDQGVHVSPDGRYLVFTSSRTGSYCIYRTDIDGNNLKQLTNGPGDAAPFFSPDGRWVIFNSTANGGSWKVPADGGESVPVTNDSWASSISPDGKLIAYVQRAGAGGRSWKITIMPFAGGAPLKTFEVTSDSRPNSRWTPDGRAITYNLTNGGPLSGVTNIWIQSLDGGPPKQLTNFTSDIFFGFDWSRDGKRLVYPRVTTTSDVVLINNFR